MMAFTHTKLRMSEWEDFLRKEKAASDKAARGMRPKGKRR